MHAFIRSIYTLKEPETACAVAVCLRCCAGETIRIKRGKKQNYTRAYISGNSFRFAARASAEQCFNVLRNAQMLKQDDFKRIFAHQAQTYIERQGVLLADHIQKLIY